MKLLRKEHERRLTTYDVYFRSDLQWGMRKFEADTPEQAVELARKFETENSHLLDLDFFEACDNPINEIEVCDDEHNTLAVWQNDDFRLRLAASDLLEAAEKVIARWKRGDLAEAVRELAAAIAKAKGGAT
jgi:hypothetical protein